MLNDDTDLSNLDSSDGEMGVHLMETYLEAIQNQLQKEVLKHIDWYYCKELGAAIANIKLEETPKFNGDKKYLCEAMNTQLPRLPVHGKHEQELFPKMLLAPSSNKVSAQLRADGPWLVSLLWWYQCLSKTPCVYCLCFLS